MLCVIVDLLHCRACRYRFESYANASVDIVTMSPALVGHRILVVLTAGTVYYDIAATLTTVADGSPTLLSLNTTIESSVLTLVLEGTGFGDIAANTSIDFTQLPASVLGQARPIVSVGCFSSFSRMVFLLIDSWLR